MSKDNRDMSIDEKFKEWFENNCIADQYENIRGLFNVVWLKDAHKAGYLIAQKELQEKLDAAIEIINELFEWDNLTSNEIYKLQERFKKLEIS